MLHKPIILLYLMVLVTLTASGMAKDEFVVITDDVTIDYYKVELSGKYTERELEKMRNVTILSTGISDIRDAMAMTVASECVKAMIRNDIYDGGICSGLRQDVYRHLPINGHTQTTNVKMLLGCGDSCATFVLNQPDVRKHVLDYLHNRYMKAKSKCEKENISDIFIYFETLYGR